MSLAKNEKGGEMKKLIAIFGLAVSVFMNAAKEDLNHSTKILVDFIVMSPEKQGLRIINEELSNEQLVEFSGVSEKFHDFAKPVIQERTTRQKAVFEQNVKGDVLNLSDGDINYIFPGVFKGFGNLKILEFPGNKLTNIAPGTFDELVSLELLDLSRNQLNNIAQGAFNGLRKLKSLYLDHNELEKVDPEVFKRLGNLITLDLQNNKLTNIDPNVFKGLGKLKWLRLEGNKLSEGNKKALREALPKNVNIYY